MKRCGAFSNTEIGPSERGGKAAESTPSPVPARSFGPARRLPPLCKGVRGAGAETPAVACTVCEKVVQAGRQPSDAPPPTPRNAVFLGLLHARPGGLSLSILPCGVLDAPARPCGRVGARRPVAGGKTDRGRMAWAAGPWGALSPPPGHRPPPRASRPLRLRPLRRDEVRKGCQRKTCLSRILFFYAPAPSSRTAVRPIRDRADIAQTSGADPGSSLRFGRDDDAWSMSAAVASCSRAVIPDGH